MKNHRIIGLMIFTVLTFSSCDDALDLLSDDPRDAFVGEWSVTENTAKKILPEYYDVSITKSSSDTTAVLISNFYAIGKDKKISASVSGSSITVSNQTGLGFTFQGSGVISYSDDEIEWSYTVDYNNGNAPDQVSATYSKK